MSVGYAELFSCKGSIIYVLNFKVCTSNIVNII